MSKNRVLAVVVTIISFLSCIDQVEASPEGSGYWQGFLDGMDHLWQRRFEEAKTAFSNAITDHLVDGESFAGATAAMVALDANSGNLSAAKERLDRYLPPKISTYLCRQYNALNAEMKALIERKRLTPERARLFLGRMCHMYNRWYGLRVSHSLDGSSGPHRQLRLLGLKCSDERGELLFQLRETTNDVKIYAYRDDGYYFSKQFKNPTNPKDNLKLTLPFSGRKGIVDTYRLFVLEETSRINDVLDLIPLTETMFYGLKPSIDAPSPLVVSGRPVKLSGRIKNKTNGTITAISTIHRKVLNTASVKPNGGFHIWVDLGKISAQPIKVDLFVETSKGLRGPCTTVVFKTLP